MVPLVPVLGCKNAQQKDVIHPPPKQQVVHEVSNKLH